MTAERQPTDPVTPDEAPLEPPATDQTAAFEAPATDAPIDAGAAPEAAATEPPTFDAPATDRPAVDAAAWAETPTVDGQPITAPPLEPPAADVAADTDTAGPPAAAAPAGVSRRGAAARGLLLFVQFAFGVVLFAAGVYLGVLAFQNTQTGPQNTGATAVSNGVPTPPVVQEFASALGSGGADAVRSSVSPEVFGLLANELQRWQFTGINKVEVLSTAIDGPRSATGLVMTGPTSTGATLSINLIVQTDGGRISTLR